MGKIGACQALTDDPLSNEQQEEFALNAEDLEKSDLAFIKAEFYKKVVSSGYLPVAPSTRTARMVTIRITML